MEKLKKLTRSELIKIYKMCRLRYGFREIARELDRNHSTIIREIERNKDIVDYNEDYYTQAEKAYKANHKRRVEGSKREKLKNKYIRHYVELHLREARWSPEIIAGKLTMLGYSISTESIYRYIYQEKPELKSCLWVASRARKRRRVGKRHRRAIIPAAEKVSIELLPAEAKNRSKIGHLELDAMLGKRGKSCVQSKVDRRSRKMFLDKSYSLKSQDYAKLVIERIKKDIPEGVVKTILQDNGSEHAAHKKVDLALGIQSYFCHPHCPSERGSVENRFGVIRRFLPKGTDIDDIPDEYIEWIEDYFNNTPMKILGFRTPNQVWFSELDVLLAA